MMKIFLMNLFLMFILCYKSKFIKLMIQNLMFLFSFIILLINCFFLKWWNLSMYFGMDLYSFGLVMLSFWILGLMIMSMNYFLMNSNLCLFFMLMLMEILLICFLSLDFLMFYMFFEISLIPTMILIIYWGLGSERISAAYYMFFYMLLFSLPLLLMLMYLLKLNGSLSMIYLSFFSLYKFKFKFMFFMLILSFLVKIPMFLIHSWLLKAHVEAPVFGSMILAALLLKLGGYGMLRILFIYYDYVIKLNNLIISISLIGCLILSVVCLSQIDLKVLVAYSSIVHMGLMLSGLMTMSKLGISGAYLLMISHGLCSSGLFYLVNINYERFNSRLMLFNKGSMSLLPSLTLWWFLLCSSNMAAPMSLNLVGEVFLISSLLFWDIKLLVMMMMICFFSFLYSLMLFSFVQHGKSLNNNNFKSIKMNEFICLMMHWFPLNLVILNLLIFI